MDEGDILNIFKAPIEFHYLVVQLLWLVAVAKNSNRADKYLTSRLTKLLTFDQQTPPNETHQPPAETLAVLTSSIKQYHIQAHYNY